MRTAINSKSSCRLTIQSSASVLAVALICVPADLASGFPGTPPPLQLGRTYVFGVAGDMTVLENQPATIDIITQHYLNQICSTFIPCPSAAGTVTITALIVPEGGVASPQSFGPYPIDEGFTQIPIQMQIAAVPAGNLEYQLTSTYSLPDSYSLSQTVTGHIGVLPESTTNPGQPMFNLLRISPGVLFGRPGDGSVRDYLLINNTAFPLDILVNASSWSLARMPSMGGAPPTSIPLTVGAYSLADPNQGQNLALAFGDEVEGTCLSLPDDHLTADPQMIQRSYRVMPGESVPVQIKARGSVSEQHGAGHGVRVTASATALAGIAGEEEYEDHDDDCEFWDEKDKDDCDCTFMTVSPPSLGGDCGDQGTGVFASIAGDPAAGSIIDSSIGGQQFQMNISVDVDQMQLLINGVPITGGTPDFSGVTQVDGQHVRNVAEFSFVIPLIGGTRKITMIIPFNVQRMSGSGVAGGGAGESQLESVEFVPGLPNGFEDQSPFAIGRVMLDPEPGFDGAIFDFIHQIWAVGVEQGTFAPVAMRNLSRSIEVVSDSRYVLTSTWTATTPPATQMIGFDVFNDFRGYARRLPDGPACPADINDDGVVDGIDLGIVLANWSIPPGAPGCGGALPCAADLNGDGVVDGIDLGIVLANWSIPPGSPGCS